jgi:hypothetical protein
MAVGILQMQPGGKKEQYTQVNEAMFGQSSPRQDQVPEGLIIHTAGPTDDGWYVYDVWESREAFQRFMDEKLGPAIRQVFGDQPPPPGSEPQYYEVDSLVAPG